MKFLFVFCLFVSSAFALHVTVVGDEVGNGKTALIKLAKEKGIVYKTIRFEKKNIKIFPNPFNEGEYYALLPVSYYDRPSQKRVQISYIQNGKTKHKNILLKIKDAKYKKETLHVSSAKVNPQRPDVKKRIAKEYNEAMKIYHTVTNKSYLHSKFILPMQSEITSAFGTARIYNGSLKGYHSGTDFVTGPHLHFSARIDGVQVNPLQLIALLNNNLISDKQRK